MPCSSHNYGYDLSVHEGCKREIDRLTDMLCRLCAEVVKTNSLNEKSYNEWLNADEVGIWLAEMPTDISNWWGIHQAQDKLRKERESNET